MGCLLSEPNYLKKRNEQEKRTGLDKGGAPEIRGQERDSERKGKRHLSRGGLASIGGNPVVRPSSE